MKLLRVLLAVAVVLAQDPLLGAFAASTARGSITIDRVSEIKYPTDQTWSPDNKTIAFLWDAAGKQDLYTVHVGDAPVALTDFPVSPDTLRSDIGAFEWVSNDKILFVKDGSIWSVTTDARKPMRVPDLAGVTVFSVAPCNQLAFARGGQVWLGDMEGKLGRQLTHLPGDLRITGVSDSPDGKYVAFNSAHAADTPDPLPFNGDRVQVLRTATWGTSLGIVSVQG